MAETNLSTFLHIIHDCLKDECKISGQEMVRQLLDIQKINFYGDEKLKSIYTGHRPLIPTEIEEYTKKDIVTDFKKYFIGILDTDKTQLLFAKFGIEKDEKIDFSVMCEAVAMQYQNFTRYGDLANTTVKSIYEILIDSKGYAGDPNANEKAINASYEMLFNALNNLCRVNPNKDQVANVKEPLEGFLQNISQTYSTLFARLNRVGRISYKSLREKHIRKNKKANKYIKMASEPGALPIELIRNVNIIVYDANPSKDAVISAELSLDDKYTKEDLISVLEGVEENDHNKYIEMFFSEVMIYHLKDEKSNIIHDIYKLTAMTRDFLNALAKELHVKANSDMLERVKKAFIDSHKVGFYFVFDGSFFQPTKTITYAPNMEQLFFDEDGYGRSPGDDKRPFNSMSPFYGETFQETFDKFTAHEIFIAQEVKGEAMNEIIVINADNTYRYYMFLPTCKARVYRKMREIAMNAADDKAVAFAAQAITVGIPEESVEKVLELPASERVRSPEGYDVLSIYGHTWKRIYSNDFLLSDIKKGVYKKQDLVSVNHVYDPIVFTIVGNYGISGVDYTSVFKKEEKPASD